MHINMQEKSILSVILQNIVVYTNNMNKIAYAKVKNLIG